VTQRTYDSELLPVQTGSNLYYSLVHPYKHLARCMWSKVISSSKIVDIKELSVFRWMYVFNREYTSEYIPEREYEMSRVWISAWSSALWCCLGSTLIINCVLWFVIYCVLLCAFVGQYMECTEMHVTSNLIFKWIQFLRHGSKSIEVSM
jgi:hypothetical protein